MNLAGGNLTLNLHYNNLLGTQDEQDRSGVEICVLKQANFRKNTAAVHTGFSQLAINIPAHAQNFAVTGSCTVMASTPVNVISASPHAHKLANYMKFTVKQGQRRDDRDARCRVRLQRTAVLCARQADDSSS